MSFYIYDTETSRIQTGKGGRNYLDHEYPTAGAARAALTRMFKKAEDAYIKYDSDPTAYEWDKEKSKKRYDFVRKNLAIAESTDYHENIEQFETTYSMYDKERKNPIRQSVNTPAYMDPGCESYWSM